MRWFIFTLALWICASTSASGDDSEIAAALRGEGLLPGQSLELPDYAGGAMHNYAIAEQVGNGNLLSITHHGSSNAVHVVQQGETNQAYTLQSGVGNAAVVYQQGTSNVAIVTQVGNGNRATVNQPATGQYLAITQVGTGLGAMVGAPR